MDDELGTIAPTPLVSPDGTRLALVVGLDRVVVDGDPRNGPAPVRRHVVLVLDARDGRRLGRAEFEGRVEYAWSASSRGLGILARDRAGVRSSVYVLKAGGRRRLVRAGATRFFWAGDALLTATWPRRRTSPAIRRHARGRIRALALRAAEREVGMPGAGPSAWRLAGVYDSTEPPRVNPRERSVLLPGSDRVTSAEDIVANGERMVGKVAATLLTEDRAFVRGRRYRIRNEGFSVSDSYRGVARRWNLGRGFFGYHSNYALFGGNSGSAGLGVVEPRTGRKRLWPDFGFDPMRYDIRWR